MSSVANVTIHCSQFPDAVRGALLESLRSRRVNHKFHYDSVKQTQKWLALHQAFSPWRTDPECRTVYDQSYLAAAKLVHTRPVQVIGLGCGGGQKDTALLKVLASRAKSLAYAPSDVSTAMVLTARGVALGQIQDNQCFPFVCDLAIADDLTSYLRPVTQTPEQPQAACILTFFGMMPNFEPAVILPKLAELTKPGDILLLSANLAPGADYAAGVERVLPLYDNEMTRDWLMSFLLDLGVEKSGGLLRFRVEEVPGSPVLRRIVADFHFHRESKFSVESEEFIFRENDVIRLFFSYRHTRALIRTLLRDYGLEIVAEWITVSGEEGVFLAQKIG